MITVQTHYASACVNWYILHVVQHNQQCRLRVVGDRAGGASSTLTQRCCCHCCCSCACACHAQLLGFGAAALLASLAAASPAKADLVRPTFLPIGSLCFDLGVALPATARLLHCSCTRRQLCRPCMHAALPSRRTTVVCSLASYAAPTQACPSRSCNLTPVLTPRAVPCYSCLPC